ncbi:hypothetical protein NNX39_00890 [Arthrobacter sp. zg-Y826]|uniref:DUF7657 domain-containing protein n=1 Tax=Arthrobacter jinronghuae TaxID=2964609 RepID=UPI0021068A9A|nr:hypothetical protein [Arthrobacter jinronghuae]MCQ1955060.1 hypothetical protein [Arthrobacter jinronghuae]
MLKTTRAADRAGAVLQPVLQWLRTGDNALRVVVVAAYAVMVLLGATTSSIGMGHLRQDPENPLGTQLGLSSGIRSDEYNAYSPIALSVMATGGAPTLSAMGARADLVHRFTSGGFFESFVFFDSGLLKLAGFLPDANVFAAHWWLPVLLLLLMMPKWFEQVGGTRRMGWLAAGLIALSPCVAWWSMMPVALIAYTLTGSSLMITAYHRFNRGQRLVAALAGLAGGILIAGMPSFYTPWSLVLGLPVLVASTLWILTRAGSLWTRIRPVLLTGVTAVVFGIGILVENSEGLNALFSTVYPGSRRSSAEAQPFALLFGAPALSPLQNGSVPVQANASELSTSFAVAFIWIAVLLAGSRLVPSVRRGIAAWTVLAFGLVWLGWCLVDLGSLGEKIPLLNLVPSVRSAQVVGVLGVIAVCLLLSMVDGRRWKTAVVAALISGAVTAYAASQMQAQYLPDMRFLVIPVAGAAVAVVVLCVTRYPHRSWPVALAVVLAALPVYRANPLVFGLGDLRESETAKVLYEAGTEARDNGTFWASNLGSFDTVSLANGVPTLSGLQRSGPDMEMWQRLDPDNEFEEAWNRGGGYVPFKWAPGAETNITTNGFDVTFVEVDPCVLADAMPELGHIASTTELQVDCLQAERTLQWSGSPVYTYRVLQD